MDGQVKSFRQWDVMEGRREIFCPEESLPQDDLVFFLLDLIPQLDLSAFYGFYSTDLRGQPPFNVPMMVTLLVYSYSVGVFSSRKIAGACERNLAAADIALPRDEHGQPRPTRVTTVKAMSRTSPRRVSIRITRPADRSITPRPPPPP